MSSPTSVLLATPPTRGLFIALFCVIFSVIFNFTLSIMASPYIVGDLGGSNDIAIYSVSFFSLGNALGMPLGSSLYCRIGTARMLVTCMLLFGCFALTSAFAPNFVILNISRLLQGLVSAPFFALVTDLLARLAPEKNRSLNTGIIVMIATVGPVIGACWGGWLTYAWSWRVVFLINAPLKFALAWFLWRRLKGYDAYILENRFFNVISYCFYFLGILGLGLTVIMGQELDWFRSDRIIAFTLIGAISLLFYIFWDLYHPAPLLNLRLLKNFVLSFALFSLTILFSAYFGMVVLLALWLTLWVNYTPDWIAVLIGTMAISGIFPLFLFHPRFRHIDGRIFLILAGTFLALSCFHTMLFNVEINFGRIAFSRILAGFGLAFFLAPIYRYCIQSVPREQVLPSLMLYQIVRSIASGMGASIYATIWLRRQVFYHERLGSELTAFSENTKAFFTRAGEVDLHGKSAYAELEDLLQRQSTALALDDCFYLMGYLFVFLLFLTILTFFFKQKTFQSLSNLRTESDDV